MGGEKFHITVTIDNEKALQIVDFLTFRIKDFFAAELNSRPRIWTEKQHALYPGAAFRLAIFLSRSAIKAATVVGFLSADICADALAL
jgi:hypothetical protein